MHIELKYSLTAEDYYEFQRAYLKHRKSLTPRDQRGLRSPLRRFWLVILGIMICFWVMISLFSSPTPVPAGAPPAAAPASFKELVVPLLPYMILFIVLFSLFAWVQRSRWLYRSLAPQALKLLETRMALVTDGHIAFRETGLYAEMEWNYFMRFIETPTVFLLFTVPRSAQIIPKRAFASGESRDEFRAFALSHIGNQPVGFPVQPPTPQ